ncbi:hypothetical protein GGS24DRAFT_499364 [Hypoxylon argillaceum]|nr:hypothetical protein GGS24DRAFT_499364 [Hypoxylon argillaceum]
MAPPELPSPDLPFQTYRMTNVPPEVSTQSIREWFVEAERSTIMASSATRYFPKLVDMLEMLGTTVSVYGKYDSLYGHEDRFKAALTSVFSHIISILLKARSAFEKKARMLLLRSIWATFESDFQSRLDKLRSLVTTLDLETTLAHRTNVCGTLAAIQLHSDPRNEEIQFSKAQKMRRKIMAWLSPAGHADHLDRVARSRTAGTGNLLLRDPDFQAWESGAARPATLWIRGGPGVGKTVLAGNIIEYLQERHTHPEGVVGFYFCDQLRGNQDDDVAVFGSLIAQICVQLENLPSQLVQAFENAQRYGRYQITTSDAPANLLKSLVAELTSYFLVIDALDELKQGFNILDFINEF